MKDEIQLQERYDQYLEAVESMDVESILKLWSGEPSDQLLSVNGTFDAPALVLKEESDWIRSYGWQSLKVIDSDFQILSSTARQGLVSAVYILLAWNPAKKTTQTFKILETQVWKQTEDGLFLNYVHQSMENTALRDDKRTDQQEKRVDGMLERLIQAGKMPPLESGRLSLQQKISRLEQALLQMEGEWKDDEFLALQNEYLKQDHHYRRITLMEGLNANEGSPTVWQGRPWSAMADGLVSFADSTSRRNPHLELHAGLEYHNHLASEPGPVFVWSAPTLPVASVLQVLHPPVHGLFTQAKQEAFARTCRSLFEQARQLHLKTLIISQEWISNLHIPVAKGLEILLQQAHPSADKQMPKLIFACDSRSLRKSLNASLEAQQAHLKQQTDLKEPHKDLEAGDAEQTQATPELEMDFPV